MEDTFSQLRPEGREDLQGVVKEVPNYMTEEEVKDELKENNIRATTATMMIRMVKTKGESRKTISVAILIV